MKISWINKFDAEGNSIGYATHQENMQKTLEGLGMIDDKDFDIAIHCTPVPHYKRIEGKINVLYTMFECSELPVDWIRNLQDIDLLIVPCTQNKELFEQYTDIPIKVLLEGCNTNYFKYIDREFPKDREFTFIWLAANNLRKGYVSILHTWGAWFKEYPNTRLILKTLPNRKEEKQLVRYFKDDGCVIDNRKLPLKKTKKLPALIDVYKYANVFMMPSMGEGFCLPLCEALSTGLPCIYTPWGGPQDYMEDFGYPADYEMVSVMMRERFMPENDLRVFKTHAAYAKPISIIEHMENIYHNYDQALEKAKRGAEMVRKKLTWEISAKNLVKILEELWQNIQEKTEVSC